MAKPRTPFSPSRRLPLPAMPRQWAMGVATATLADELAIIVTDRLAANIVTALDPHGAGARVDSTGGGSAFGQSPFWRGRAAGQGARPTAAAAVVTTTLARATWDSSRLSCGSRPMLFLTTLLPTLPMLMNAAGARPHPSALAGTPAVESSPRSHSTAAAAIAAVAKVEADTRLA